MIIGKTDRPRKTQKARKAIGVGRAVRALAPKARTARPTSEVLNPGKWPNHCSPFVLSASSQAPAWEFSAGSSSFPRRRKLELSGLENQRTSSFMAFVLFVSFVDHCCL